MYEVRVVIADNQEESLKRIKQTLSLAGHNIVAEARDGRTALKLIRNYEPELIIIDANLSGMSGVEVAKIVSEEMLAPVIMVSSFYTKEIVEQAKDAMVTALLIKPTDHNNLLAAVEIGLANFEKIKDLQQEVIKLRDSLESRKTVEKAKGLLMVKLGLTEGEAFKKIQKQSMENRKTMKEIAESIILAFEI